MPRLSYLAAFLAAACLWASPAHPQVEPSEEAPDRVRLEHRFDLLAILNLHAPIDLHDEMLARAKDLYNFLWHERGAGDGESVERETEEFFNRLRERYALLQLDWTADGLQWREGEQTLSASLPVSRHVLVDLRNAMNHEIHAQAVFAGAAEIRVRPALIPPGETRLLYARLGGEADAAQPAEATLQVTRSAGETQSIPVPLKVEAPATLRGTVIDEDTGEAWPARVSVFGADHALRRGKKYAGVETVRQKQILEFRTRRAEYQLPFFYCDGEFEVDVPAGEATVVLERGFEHDVVTRQVTLEPGQTHEFEFTIPRLVDMKAKGWVSGDTHVHWVENNWRVNEDLALLDVVQKAEGLRVANNLLLIQRWPDPAFIAPSQFPMGPVPGYAGPEYHIQMGEEYRNEEFYGHLCLLNIKYLVLPIGTGRQIAGPDALDYPINKTAIEETRAQGGISIEAHSLGRNWDVPVNVIHGLTDSLDQMNPPDYYRFLDCGFRLPLSNGSDHPARVVGCARVYVKVDGEFTYERWIEGIRQCSTFTTSGPLLFLKANGADIGDDLDVSKGDTVNITAEAISRHPLGAFQILHNGDVIAEANTDETRATLEKNIQIDEPGWLIARSSRSASFSAITGPGIAHTSAIYILVDGERIMRPEAAREWARRMREHAEDVRQNARFLFDSQREKAVGYIEEGVARYEAMLDE